MSLLVVGGMFSPRACATVANGTISGWVTNATNAAIAGATITTNGTGVTPASTNGSGYYVISVPPGTYNVTAEALGYLDSYEIAPLVAAGATVAVNFTLGVRVHMFVDPSSYTGTHVGDVFTVNVMLTADAFWDVAGTDVTFTYDPTLINLTSATVGHFLQQHGEAVYGWTHMSVPGKVWSVYTKLSDATPSSGTDSLLTMTFTVLKLSTTYPLLTCQLAVGPTRMASWAHEEREFAPWLGNVVLSADLGGYYDVANGTYTAAAGALPDFAISASPPTLTMMPGTSGNSTVTVTGLNGFQGTVVLAVGSAQGNSTPAGTQLTLTSQLSPPFPAGANLTVGIAPGAPTGDFWLNVTGTSGSLVRFALVHVIVPSGLPVPESGVIVGVLMMFFAFAAFYLNRKSKLHLIRNR